MPYFGFLSQFLRHVTLNFSGHACQVDSYEVLFQWWWEQLQYKNISYIYKTYAQIRWIKQNKDEYDGWMSVVK